VEEDEEKEDSTEQLLIEEVKIGRGGITSSSPPSLPPSFAPCGC